MVSATLSPLTVLTPLTFAASASQGRWVPAKHLLYIDRAVHDSITGVRPERLIVIETPPRHGKSEYVSHWLPSWFIGRWPDKRVMLAAYSGNFASHWGRLAKHTVEEHGPAYFGVTVSRETRGASRWDIEGHRGGMSTAGIGGLFTGMGADLLIIDDPVKNAEEAISDVVREAHWQWWQSTAWSRIEPEPGKLSGVAIVIMTRWHVDDLAGRLIRWAETRPNLLRQITLPAFARENDLIGRQPGEPLWPQRLSHEFLELRKSMLDAYWWEALYQQNPGSYGKNEWPASYFDGIWVEPREWPGTFEASVIALDPSKGKDSKKGDFTAAVYMGLVGGKLWIDAQVRRRPVPLMCAESVAFAAAHGCDHFGVESNAFQDLLIGPLDDAAEEAGGVPLPIAEISNTINKQLRISRLGPYLARSKFRFARNPDTELLVEQLRGFPFAEHDDGPDALEMALRLMRWHLRGSSGTEYDQEEVLST